MRIKSKKLEPFLIRAHRIVPQLIFLVAMVYFYGWLAMLLSVFIIACEVPYHKFDEWANPWYRRYIIREKERELAEQLQEYFDDDNDGLDDNCPHCGREYDPIDHEYQICSICNHHNQKNIFE